MGTKFASSRRAIAMCDICGFQYKLSQLSVLVRKGFSTNLKACPTCFDPDHPQLKLGLYPVHDPQAIRDPRPDTSLGNLVITAVEAYSGGGTLLVLVLTLLV